MFRQSLSLPRVAWAIGAVLAASAVATGCFGRSDLVDLDSPVVVAFDGGSESGGSVNGGGRAGGVGGRPSSGGRTGVAGSSGATSGGRTGVAGSGGIVGNGGLLGAAGSGGAAASGGSAGSTGGGTGGAVGTCGGVACAGCCSSGRCVPGNNDNACGLAGVACLDCGSSGFGCDQGTCQGTPETCGPATCDGCCDTLGRCRLGTELDACGVSGEVCRSCAANQDCRSSACVAAPPPPCSATTCGGCCSAQGVCLSGTADTTCGASGALCANCTTSSKKCNQPRSYCAFLPACSSTTCPTGCCDATGVCRDGRTDLACGATGQACTDCAGTGDHCAASGFCYAGPHCGPDNCGGCCTPDGQCRPGTGNRACGLYGGICENCVSNGTTCQAGACGTTGQTCPSPYAGCSPGALTSPPAPGTSCTPADLSSLAKACASAASGETGTGQSAACRAGLASLLTTNPGCFDCMQQFTYDGAVAKCLAPFLNATCNHALTCAVDCSGSCSDCSAAGQKACQETAFASGGACNAYVSGQFCAAAAYGGPGAFCDAQRISDIGLWLQGVGAYYCSK